MSKTGGKKERRSLRDKARSRKMKHETEEDKSKSEDLAKLKKETREHQKEQGAAGLAGAGRGGPMKSKKDKAKSRKQKHKKDFLRDASQFDGADEVSLRAAADAPPFDRFYKGLDAIRKRLDESKDFNTLDLAAEHIATYVRGGTSKGFLPKSFRSKYNKLLKGMGIMSVEGDGLSKTKNHWHKIVSEMEAAAKRLEKKQSKKASDDSHLVAYNLMMGAERMLFSHMDKAVSEARREFARFSAQQKAADKNFGGGATVSLDLLRAATDKALKPMFQLFNKYQGRIERLLKIRLASQDAALTREVIRVAHANPELRPLLLPLLTKEAAPMRIQPGMRGPLTPGIQTPSSQLTLQPMTVYWMGASSSPTMIITTKISKDTIEYIEPFDRKKRRIERWIGADLIAKGSTTWLARYAQYQPEYAKSISSMLKGGPGKKEKMKDWDRIAIVVEAKDPKKDLWRQAEQYGSVAGIHVPHYIITGPEEEVSKVKKDSKFVVVDSEKSMSDDGYKMLTFTVRGKDYRADLWREADGYGDVEEFEVMLYQVEGFRSEVSGIKSDKSFRVVSERPVALKGASRLKKKADFLEDLIRMQDEERADPSYKPRVLSEVLDGAIGRASRGIMSSSRDGRVPGWVLEDGRRWYGSSDVVTPGTEEMVFFPVFLQHHVQLLREKGLSRRDVPSHFPRTAYMVASYSDEGRSIVEYGTVTMKGRKVPLWKGNLGFTDKAMQKLSKHLGKLTGMWHGRTGKYAQQSRTARDPGWWQEGDDKWYKQEASASAGPYWFWPQKKNKNGGLSGLMVDESWDKAAKKKSLTKMDFRAWKQVPESEVPAKVRKWVEARK